MKPLSLRRRRIYLFVFGLIFVISIPLLILYATGYRVGDALNLIRTGGLHISAPYSGVQVTIGDSISKETSVFQKNIFVQNLRPGSYEVRVTKPGFQSWSKRLNVFPQRVTEGYSFLLPEKFEMVEIPEFLEEPPQTATSTRKVVQKKNPKYSTANLLFATTTKTATSSDVVKTRRKLSVMNKDGVIHAVWGGEMDSVPHYFCVNESCKDEIIVEVKSKVKTFDFLPGRDDVLIVALTDGIYAVEIDDRSLQNTQVIVQTPRSDFRMQGETLILKQDKKLFEISL